MKLTRNSKIFINYFLGPILFCWLAWSIYQQIIHQAGLKQAWDQLLNSWGFEKMGWLVVGFFLMFVNWGLEAMKWKLAVQSIQQLSFGRAFLAILAGLSFSVTTPNRIGEYFGRLIYVKEGSRLRSISSTIVGSLSQLIITLFFGFAGLLVMRHQLISEELISDTWMQVILSGVSLVLVGCLLFYFRLRLLVDLARRIPRAQKLFYLVEALEQMDRSTLVKMLALSVFRFLVFSLQYYLFFYLFEVNMSAAECFWSVNVSFLVMAVIPTIAIAELAQRGKVLISLAGLYSANHLGITLATASIWLVNLILPAIAGSLLILRQRSIVKD